MYLDSDKNTKKIQFNMRKSNFLLVFKFILFFLNPVICLQHMDDFFIPKMNLTAFQKTKGASEMHGTWKTGVGDHGILELQAKLIIIDILPSRPLSKPNSNFYFMSFFLLISSHSTFYSFIFYICIPFLFTISFFFHLTLFYYLF